MIAWELYSGDEVERIIATYICLQDPYSVRVRPSQGDGGIDVIKTLEDGGKCVYQIKRFASNLKSSQKNQIIDSWNRVNEYVNNHDIRLTEWILVMPLDPTNENRIWFEGLVSNRNVKATWLGRSHIDGWAARMPYVADYYLYGNRESIMSIAKTMLDGTRPDITNETGLVHQISSIQEMLNTIDPNYAYDFQVINGFEFDESLVFESRPGLVMSTMMETDDGKTIRIDVLAKHGAATELSPISTKITFYAEDEQQKSDLRSFVDYGTPLINFPALIEKTDGLVFGGLEKSGRGTISTYSRGAKRLLPISIENAFGSSKDLVQTDLFEGQKGVVWEGTTKDDMLALRIRVNKGICLLGHEDDAGLDSSFSDSESDIVQASLIVSITWNFDFLKHDSLANALRKLRFLTTLCEEGFAIKLYENELVRIDPSQVGISEERIVDLAKVAEMLALIDTVSSKEISFPEVLTVSEFEGISRIYRLIESGEVTESWSSFGLAELPDALPIGPLHITYVQELELLLNSQKYRCGYVQYQAIGVWNAEECEFTPHEDYGNTVLIKYLGSENETGFDNNKIFVKLLDSDFEL